MIPLRDNNPTRSFPLVTVLLIAINAWVFYLQYKSGGAITDSYSMVPRDIVTGHSYTGLVTVTNHGLLFRPGIPAAPLAQNQIYLGPPPFPVYITIFSAMFLHANLLHIGGNMLALWIFGNNVEDALGKVRYILFYFVCGVAAAAAQIAINPDSLIPTLGASGAIAGVMGAYIVMYPGAKIQTLIWLGIIGFFREVSAFWVIAIWILLEIIPAVSSSGTVQYGGVAHFAHIGGFAMGIFLVLLMGGRRLAVNVPRVSRVVRR